MSTSYEQQLARSDELPLEADVMSYLQQQATSAEGQHLYQRFLWELRREREPRQALDMARFAVAYGPSETPRLSDALQKLKVRVGREPHAIQSGSSLELAGRLKLVNLSGRRVEIAGSEIRLAGEQLTKPDQQLTIVIDDHLPSARYNGQQLIWNIPVQAEDSRLSWLALVQAVNKQGQLPAWTDAISNNRHLVSTASLPSEHAVRAERTRSFVAEVLLDHSYGPSSEEMTQLDEEEVAWVLLQLDHFFEHYTSHPRLALSCRSLQDFSPLADWQQPGPEATKALIASVTGDDPSLIAALSSVDRMRIGTLAFTGDPDNNGDDLLSAVLPPQDCAVVLRPEALESTLFLTGIPHPSADLPVPQRRHGFYNTLAVGSQVTEMLLTRAYLGLTPASAESVRDYFQGRAQEIALEESTSNPAFQALVTAVMIRRQQGEDNPMVRAALRVAAAHSIYVGLARDPMRDAIGGIHLGGLDLSSVEQVVVPLIDGDEWRHYHKSGKLPNRLNKTQSYLSSFDINLRGRAPVGHGSMVSGL